MKDIFMMILIIANLSSLFFALHVINKRDFDLIKYRTYIESTLPLVYQAHMQDLAAMKQMKKVIDMWDSCDLCRERCVNLSPIPRNQTSK